jgi:hypothetical protein
MTTTKDAMLQLISFVWRTRWWPTRQFTFFLGLAEVNAANTRTRALKQTPAPVLEFRRDLANEMLNNTLGMPLEPSRGLATRSRRSVSASDGTHRFMERPLNTTKLLGTSRKHAKDPYQKTVCSGVGCKSRCKTYCACNKAACLCLECFNLHISNV